MVATPAMHFRRLPGMLRAAACLSVLLDPPPFHTFEPGMTRRPGLSLVCIICTLGLCVRSISVMGGGLGFLLLLHFIIMPIS